MSLGEEALIEQDIAELVNELNYRKAMKARELRKEDREYHFGKRVDKMEDSHLVNAYKYYRLRGNHSYACKFYNELKRRYPDTIENILKGL